MSFCTPDDGYDDDNDCDDPQLAGVLEHLLLCIVVPLVTSLHWVVAHGEADKSTFS